MSSDDYNRVYGISAAKGYEADITFICMYGWRRRNWGKRQRQQRTHQHRGLNVKMHFILWFLSSASFSSLVFFCPSFCLLFWMQDRMDSESESESEIQREAFGKNKVVFSNFMYSYLDCAWVFFFISFFSVLLPCLNVHLLCCLACTLCYPLISCHVTAVMAAYAMHIQLYKSVFLLLNFQVSMYSLFLWFFSFFTIIIYLVGV